MSSVPGHDGHSQDNGDAQCLLSGLHFHQLTAGDVAPEGHLPEEVCAAGAPEHDGFEMDGLHMSLEVAEDIELLAAPGTRCVGGVLGADLAMALQLVLIGEAVRTCEALNRLVLVTFKVRLIGIVGEGLVTPQAVTRVDAVVDHLDVLLQRGCV